MSEEGLRHLDAWAGDTLAKLVLVLHEELAHVEDWPDNMSCVFESSGVAVRVSVEFMDEGLWEVEDGA